MLIHKDAVYKMQSLYNARHIWKLKKKQPQEK